MALDYSNLTIGQQISNRNFVVDNDSVSKYVFAVGGRSETSDPSDEYTQIHVMAIAGMSLGELVKDLGIPENLVHVGQELKFNRATSTGEQLTSTATVTQNAVRNGSRLIGIMISVSDNTGMTVMDGKSTLIMPA